MQPVFILGFALYQTGAEASKLYRAMDKLDYTKDLKQLYQPSARAVVQVVVPRLNYLMLDGRGDPNTSPAYQHAVETLFALSYTIKFLVKKGPLAVDYRVMPLEGLWWADDMASFATLDKSNWQWTAMVVQPDLVPPDLVAQALAQHQQKAGAAEAVVPRFVAWEEGLCAQTLHVGPFSDMGPTIARLHRFIAEADCQPAGKHHEIYLSDIRRAAPARWKTVLRQPMARGAA